MSHYAHWILIAVALVMNWGDRKAIALTLIVGLSVLIPFNQFTDWTNFYLVVILSEIIVALCALRINTRASVFIVLMCLMLVAFHLVGWDAGGHKIGSPYRLLAKIAEYAELIACIAFANPIIRLLKNDPNRNFRG